ncbi:hypothetical protein ACOME3_004094 [Neoechinorhynchus agilis]
MVKPIRIVCHAAVQDKIQRKAAASLIRIGRMVNRPMNNLFLFVGQATHHYQFKVRDITQIYSSHINEGKLTVQFSSIHLNISESTFDELKQLLCAINDIVASRASDLGYPVLEPEKYVPNQNCKRHATDSISIIPAKKSAMSIALSYIQDKTNQLQIPEILSASKFSHLLEITIDGSDDSIELTDLSRAVIGSKTVQNLTISNHLHLVRLPLVIDCPNLVSLTITDNPNLGEIPGSLFVSIKSSLASLDLSHNGICRLPQTFCLLSRLMVVNLSQKFF